MFTVTFKDDLSKLCEEVLLDKQSIELAFLRIYQQATHRFKQIIEDLDEIHISCLLLHIISVLSRHWFLGSLSSFSFTLFHYSIEYLEEELNAYRTDFQRALGALDSKQGEGTLQERL